MDEVALALLKKASDKTITIEEFLALGVQSAKGRPQAKSARAKATHIMNNLIDAGVDLKQPWSEFATKASFKKYLPLPEFNETVFAELGWIENRVEEFYNVLSDEIPEVSDDYPFTSKNKRIGNKGGIARQLAKFEPEEAVAAKTKLGRKSKKFKKVPKSSITIPKLVEAIKSVKDPDIRAALAFNMLVPFRPGEIGYSGEGDAQIKLGDVDFEQGYIEGYTRGNKTRPSVNLSNVSLEILRDASERSRQHFTAIYNALDRPNVSLEDYLDDKPIFHNVTRESMTTALKNEGLIVQKFRPNKTSMGRLIEGASDIRKLVPSVLARHLGADAGAVSSLLGHDKTGAILNDLARISAAHYVSEIDDPDFDPIRRAYESLENLIGRELGFESLNEIPASLRVSAKNLYDPENPNAAHTIKIPEDDFVRPTATPPTEAEIESRDARFRESTAQAKLGEAKAQKELLETRLDIAQLEPKVAEVEVGADEEKKKLKFNKLKVIRKEYEALQLKLQNEGSLSDWDQFLYDDYEKQLKITPDIVYSAPSNMPDLNVDPDTGEVIVTPEEMEELYKKLDDAPEPDTTGRKGKIIPRVVKGLATAATFLTAGKVKAGVDIGTEVAIEALMPSEMGSMLENNPEDIPDEHLLTMLQEGFSGTAMGIEDASIRISNEIERRIGASEDVVERASTYKGSPIGRIASKMQAEEAEKWKEGFLPKTEQAYLERDITDVTSIPDEPMSPFGDLTERQLNPQKFKIESLEDEIELEEGDLMREYEGFLTPKKPDVMERLQTFRSNRQSFLDQPPQ